MRPRKKRFPVYKPYDTDDNDRCVLFVDILGFRNLVIDSASQVLTLAGASHIPDILHVLSEDYRGKPTLERVFADFHLCIDFHVHKSQGRDLIAASFSDSAFIAVWDFATICRIARDL